MNKIPRLIFFFWVFFSVHGASAELVLSLNKNWMFSQTGQNEYLPAEVPGSVHLDLLKNGKIADPFLADNEKTVQWIDTCSWDYRCNFDVPSKLLKNNHVELEFEGLDTYAEVTLNGFPVLKSDNMFRTYSVDVRTLLKTKGNVLLVHFVPAQMVARRSEEKNRLKIPGGERVFARKAAFQWGWDFGPRFLGCGIWKPVKLHSWQSISLVDVQVLQQVVSDSIAKVVIGTTISSDLEQQIVLDYVIQPSLEHSASLKTLHAGTDLVYDTVVIRNPQRWWTNELGTPFCYSAQILIKSSGKTIDGKKVTFGLRDLELIQEKDALGTSFISN